MHRLRHAILSVDAGPNANDATQPLRLSLRRADQRDRAAALGALRLLGVAAGAVFGAIPVVGFAGVDQGNARSLADQLL